MAVSVKNSFLGFWILNGRERTVENSNIEQVIPSLNAMDLNLNVVFWFRLHAMAYLSIPPGHVKCIFAENYCFSLFGCELRNGD